jgi:NTP pyrophosphatase (non-canonical NTP hydrolase)
MKLSELNLALLKRDLEWIGRFPSKEDLLFNSNELAGETGEACNWVKKLVRTRRGISGGVPEEVAIAALRKELADVVICAFRVAAVENINIEEAVIDKFNETSEKHGFKTRL